MAIQQGAFNFTQKFANAVGRKGRAPETYIASIHVKKIKNPNTETQQQIRTKFKMLGSFGTKCMGFCKIGYGSKRNPGETWLNAFNRVNFDDGITGTWPSFVLNYTKLCLAQGPVDNPYNPAATIQGSDINITWTDNSGIGNARDSDKVMFIVYNTDKKQSIVDSEAADRSTRQATYSLPSSWSGDKIVAYFAMQRVATRECSDSIYLGEFTLS